MGQKRLTPEALRLLEAHDWPGNVRELENEIERLVVLSGESPVITDALVSPRVRRGARAAAGRPGDPDGDRGALHGAVEDLERTLILEALRRTSWNKTRAAQALGVSRRNLIRKVKALGLDRRRSP